MLAEPDLAVLESTAEFVPPERQDERVVIRSHVSMLVYLVGLCQGPDV